ncbi:EcsC family protein [Nocardioides sp. Y6]|uniref:EcsC family protein n=1 Tax=Nocardioides malaquae TaxID=2773426 RepID=A0ABR9RSK5_9ACTN|nr:EcsC family protein [Nocardioides malaquae]MBE7324553.1 EcsC family protein [Nocardioides malaquae]
MGIRKNVMGTVTGKIAPQVAQAAPGVTSRAVLEALDRAIDGVGPLKPAVHAAEKQLAEHNGDALRAVRDVVENHVRLSGIQGFVTNIGGLATAAVTMPTNVVGLAVLQARMIAGITHLSGHDVADPRVRNAVLAAMLGEEGVEQMVKKGRLPGSPLTLATAQVHDPELRTLLATEVGAFLVSKVAGRRLVTVAGRRVPVVGGVVGAGADGWSTWRVGRYAEKEFTPLRKRR